MSIEEDIDQSSAETVSPGEALKKIGELRDAARAKLVAAKSQGSTKEFENSTNCALSGPDGTKYSVTETTMGIGDNARPSFEINITPTKEQRPAYTLASLGLDPEVWSEEFKRVGVINDPSAKVIETSSFYTVDEDAKTGEATHISKRANILVEQSPGTDQWVAMQVDAPLNFADQELSNRTAQLAEAVLVPPAQAA